MSRLQKSLGVSGADQARRDVIEKRLAEAKSGTQPGFANVSKAKRIELFEKILKVNGADIEHTTKKSDIAKIVSHYLKAHNLPARLKCGLKRRRGHESRRCRPVRNWNPVSGLGRDKPDLA